MRSSVSSKKSQTIRKLNSIPTHMSLAKIIFENQFTNQGSDLYFNRLISNDLTNGIYSSNPQLPDNSHRKLCFKDNLSYEEELSKHSDQDTEESTSCLRSITSEGKNSRIRDTMEIENFNSSNIFNNSNQIDTYHSSRSPSPKKKINRDFQYTIKNLKITDEKSLHTPTKPLLSLEDRRAVTDYLQFKSKKRSDESSRFVNDFEVVEVIGSGSYGKVYRCIHKLDKNEYAVKETFRKFSGRHKVYGLNEIQALASLNAIEENINVVRYYNSWVEDEKLYLVMEYCPMSLKGEITKKGRFSELELKKILRDVCLGLNYLHRNLIVHLDVKPENILISKASTYKLGDMGQSALAKLSSDEIEEGDARYLAPELLNSEEYPEKPELTKADVFSLGITLLELATGCALPVNGNEWQNLRNERLDILDQVVGLSSSFKKLIKLMLKRNPAERPSVKDLLVYYLPDKVELELRWEKIQRGMLEGQKKKLEGKVKTLRKRRRSV